MSYTKYSVTAAGQNAKVLRKKAGAYLKRLREDKKLTQTELAKRVDLEYYTFISQIETGLARVPPEKIGAFAQALGLSPKALTKELMRYYDPITYESLFGSE